MNIIYSTNISPQLFLYPYEQCRLIRLRFFSSCTSTPFYRPHFPIPQFTIKIVNPLQRIEKISIATTRMDAMASLEHLIQFLAKYHPNFRDSGPLYSHGYLIERPFMSSRSSAAFTFHRQNQCACSCVNSRVNIAISANSARVSVEQASGGCGGCRGWFVNLWRIKHLKTIDGWIIIQTGLILNSLSITGTKLGVIN